MQKKHYAAVAAIIATLLAGSIGFNKAHYKQNSASVAVDNQIPASNTPIPQISDSSANTGAICHINGALPDPNCTPGATNTDVSQETISQNICNPNWSTKSIRPPVSYTTPLKIKQIAEYGFTDTNTASYEEDHLISLEIGGSPTDPKNLWPEPYNIPNGAKTKDLVENYLHKMICAGSMTLLQAQQGVTSDWTQYLPNIKNSSNNFGATVSDPDDN